MLPFQKLLFAVDFSPACAAVVPYVRDMAGRNGAELTLLHATGIVPMESIEVGGFTAESLPLYAEIRKMKRGHLEEFAKQYFGDMEPRLTLEDGDAVAAITRTVKHEGVDLVMMPTHGKGALRRLLLGSVTGKILHDLDCAVWTGVHHPEDERKPKLPYRSVVCAVDFQDEDVALVRAAGSIAKSYGAKLTIAHAVDIPRAYYWPEYPMYQQDSVRKGLRELAAEAEVEAEISLVEARPAEGVRKAVMDAEGDLLIVGRGLARKAVSRLWSNLYGIIREAPCPVISI